MSIFSSIGDAIGKVGKVLNPIAPILSIGSSVLGSINSASAARDANRTNVELARETNETQIELANTAHQREMKDLAAAGLNPILSAKYGGSDTPGLTRPEVESLAATFSNSANSVRDAALHTRSLAADIEVKKSQAMANSALAIKTGAEARSAAYDADVKEMLSDLEKWKLGERKKSRGWDLMLDDIKRGATSILPFTGR